MNVGDAGAERSAGVWRRNLRIAVQAAGLMTVRAATLVEAGPPFNIAMIPFLVLAGGSLKILAECCAQRKAAV